jgi:pimeloyl-ACP methyl ester carboxylesterase
MSDRRLFAADFVEAGTGPLVLLVHASLSGARQWGALTDALKSRYRVRALNLFGYGRTADLPGDRPPALDDYAELVLSAIPGEARTVMLVGHSFGGAVAMQAARRLGKRAARLVLIEPSIFSLLEVSGRSEAYAEITAVARDMGLNPPEQAAQRFIDYWSGPGAWTATPEARRAAYMRGVGLVRREFGAAFGQRTTLDEWSVALPRKTLVTFAADTTRPSREIADLLSLAGAGWEFARIPRGGHMSPLTQPDLVNPVIAQFLDRL